MEVNNSNKVLTCRNQGCGKQYIACENTSKSCIYHSKPPYFHDMIKMWPCCNKKSYNFSDFLSIPGCTISYHNDKPDGELLYDIKNKLKPSAETILKDNEMIKKAAVNKYVNLHDRSPFDMQSSKNFRVTVNPSLSLVSAIEQLNLSPLKNEHISPTNQANQSTIASTLCDKKDITLGTQCHRYGCNKIYTDRLDLHDECVYHDGIPIFHDGSKYWSCCRIKKSDFNEFWNQKGCCIGLHDFVSPIRNLSTECRFDFYQQNNTIIVSFYAKLIDYTQCNVIADPYNLLIEFVYQSDRKFFSKKLALFDEIYPEKTTASATPYKLEINLTVVNPNKTWTKLEHSNEKIQ